MEIDIPVFTRLFSGLLFVLSSLIQLLGGNKTLFTEKQEILRWVSESAGREIRSLQQLWEIGPICLGKYIEQLNSQDVTWWSLQDLARATFAVPQVMTKTDMCRSQLNGVSERKFLRLLKRLKEAFERTVGNDSSHRLRVSSDIIAKGVALSSAYTAMRGVFFVYSYRNQLEGIQIQMDGPGIAKVETKTRRDGLMVSYIASRRGMYTLEISKNNWFAPGSPFVVNVQDPPVGYKGSFGGALWDTSDTYTLYTPPTVEHNSLPNSLIWDGEHETVVKTKVVSEGFPSRPGRKKIFQKPPPQVVELSQVAAAIILARRFTNRMQSRIPELRIERPCDAQELNLWSNMLTPSPSSLREITYVSPEGATFPISVNGRRDGGREKWMESREENFDEWMSSPSSDPNQGNEVYLQSLICPVRGDRLSKMKKSPVPYVRSQHNMVRPFNHGVMPVSGSEPPKQGRIWTQSVSIGVNTEESCIDPKSRNVAQPPKISKGVQVGKSCPSFELYDNNNLYPLSDPETRSKDPKKTRPELARKFLMSRAKKSGTFNSDDTSSSVTTNYSEKIIEMDLKVNYETIALTSTDDDELSQSEVWETKRYLSLNDTSYGLPSIADSNCSSFKVEEAIKPFSIDKSPGNCEEIENGRENVQASVDGIYKATLMSLGNSISAFDRSSESELSDNEMTPVKIRTDQPANFPKAESEPVPSPRVVKNNAAKHIKTYESIVSADGQLLTIIVGDEVEIPCNDAELSLRYFSTNPSEVLSGESSNENSQTRSKKIDLKHFKYLTKRHWTKKISSRRLIKQRSGTCKKQLRKTLAFIPRLSDHRNLADPRTNLLYSFGSYPVTKDVVHIPTSVRAWKQFWDNIATKPEAKVRRDVQRNETQTDHEKLTERSSKLRQSLKDEDRKRRFETAKQHFAELEKEKKVQPLMATTKSCVYEKVLPPQKLDQHWDLKGLFDDFNKGLGKPGVANRLGVLASLYSVEPRFSVAGFNLQYPHLPVSSSSSSESSPISKKTISPRSELDHDSSMQLISFDPDMHNGNPSMSRLALTEGVNHQTSMQLVSLDCDIQNEDSLLSEKAVTEVNHDVSMQPTSPDHGIQDMNPIVLNESITSGLCLGAPKYSISLEPDTLSERPQRSVPILDNPYTFQTVPLELGIQDNASFISSSKIVHEVSDDNPIQFLSLEPNDRKKWSIIPTDRTLVSCADESTQPITPEPDIQDYEPPTTIREIARGVDPGTSILRISLEY